MALLLLHIHLVLPNRWNCAMCTAHGYFRHYITVAMCYNRGAHQYTDIAAVSQVLPTNTMWPKFCFILLNFVILFYLF